MDPQPDLQKITIKLAVKELQSALPTVSMSGNAVPLVLSVFVDACVILEHLFGSHRKY